MTNPRPEDTPGPAAQAFPSTCWSRILGPQAGSQGTQTDIEALAQAYWRPVYGYVRAHWARSNEDAVDCTQDFFVWMMERGFLSRADPKRGRFRGFLKTSLRNFLSDRERERRAQKRGGDRVHLRLQITDDDLPELAPAAAQQTPDEILDSLWRAALVERATQTLEQELRALGKETYFEVFSDYFLSSADDMDYAEISRRYDLTSAQVSNYLMHAKKRYRQLLRAAVMETVTNPEDLEQELRWLFGERWS